MNDERFVYLIDKAYSLLALVIKFGIPAWAAVRIAEALAGKTTLASVAIDIFKAEPSLAGYLIAFVVAILWALVERRLRRRKTKYLHRRIKRLEERLDADRSSSMLTESGDTNPRDK